MFSEGNEAIFVTIAGENINFASLYPSSLREDFKSLEKSTFLSNTLISEKMATLFDVMSS